MNNVKQAAAEAISQGTFIDTWQFYLLVFLKNARTEIILHIRSNSYPTLFQVYFGRR